MSEPRPLSRHLCVIPDCPRERVEPADYCADHLQAYESERDKLAAEYDRHTRHPTSNGRCKVHGRPLDKDGICLDCQQTVDYMIQQRTARATSRPISPVETSGRRDWRGIFNLPRIRIIGSGSLDDPGTYAYIAVEMWTDHPGRTTSETVEALERFFSKAGMGAKETLVPAPAMCTCGASDFRRYGHGHVCNNCGAPWNVTRPEKASDERCAHGALLGLFCDDCEREKSA